MSGYIIYWIIKIVLGLIASMVYYNLADRNNKAVWIYAILGFCCFWLGFYVLDLISTILVRIFWESGDINPFVQNVFLGLIAPWISGIIAVIAGYVFLSLRIRKNSKL